MNYHISITLIDNKPCNVIVSEDQFENFMKAIKSNELFFDDKNVQGFYIPLDKIKFMHFSAIKEDKALDDELLGNTVPEPASIDEEESTDA